MTAPLRARAAGAACALVVAVATAGTARAVTPAPTTEGHLTAQRGGALVEVPLTHTDVRLRVDGMLVDATVTQRFHDPYPDAIEAVYLFPLPTGAAVDDLIVKSGDRTIHAQIAERAAAQRTYAAARDHGQLAALLTQERPNLFTQRLANLAPGATIEVTLHYVQRLDLVDGGYELAVPMVAPPRPIVDAAADDAAVRAVTLPPGQRSARDVSVAVELDAAVPLTALESPSHAVVVERPGPTRARVHLAPGDTIPNKDFVLRYRVAGAAAALGALAYRDGDGDGSVVLVAQPPATDAASAIAPRELLFVLDTSSSMRGRPLAAATELVRVALGRLRADDTYQIVRFDDDAAALSAAPIARSPKNLARTLAWLDQLTPGGATDVDAGLAAALAQPHDLRRLRIVVFVSDGYVGDEDALLARVTPRLGDARLFCVGVGTAVNRYLLEELARAGRGALQVIRPDEPIAPAVDAFERRIAAPVLTDLAIDWGGLPVHDVTPARVPDVFLGQPLVLAGHYARGARGTVTVHATQGGRPVTLTLAVDLPDRDAARPAVATVWARGRIAELSRALVRAPDAAIERQIVALSLASHVLTRYTALVAVDPATASSHGAPRTVTVPVEVPEDVAGIGPASSVGGGIMGTISGSGYGFGAVGYGGGGAGYGISFGHSAGVLGVHALHGDGAPVPRVTIPTPTVRGGLDAAIVRRYLKRNAAKLQYCYEKALLAAPGLRGDLVADFVIAADGHVTDATTSGVAPDVASCALGVVQGIEFPRPPSGPTQVHVSLALEVR